MTGASTDMATPPESVRERTAQPPSRSLREAPEYGRMAASIKARMAGRRAAYFTNPGNLGDSLIEAGALAFLDANNIPVAIHNSRQLRELHARYYRLAYVKNLSLEFLSAGLYKRYPLSLQEISKKHAVAIICGSGGFAEQARVAMRIHELCCGWFSDVIVLPTTYSLPPRVRKNSMFFARDKFDSLRVVPDAAFCHDMAFFLSPAAITPRRRVGYHLRKDNERSGSLPEVADNLDISAGGTELDPPDRLFEEVGRSETIVTDRLHVCIAAALLGRHVYLFGGNYFKIEAIFRSSIEPNFPNVSYLRSWEELSPGLRS